MSLKEINGYMVIV